MSEHHFHRARPSHCPPIARHNTATILLVTVCVKERRKVLATSAAQDALVGAWHKAADWMAGYYLIMPDHIHVFCAPGRWGRASVQRWVGYWKRLAGEQAPELRRVFQRNCWDRQMRDAEHYSRKQTYVAENPVRAGLADEPAAWPYQGRLSDLSWLGGI